MGQKRERSGTEIAKKRSRSVLEFYKMKRSKEGDTCDMTNMTAELELWRTDKRLKAQSWRLSQISVGRSDREPEESIADDGVEDLAELEEDGSLAPDHWMAPVSVLTTGKEIRPGIEEEEGEKKNKGKKETLVQFLERKKKETWGSKVQNNVSSFQELEEKRKAAAQTRANSRGGVKNGREPAASEAEDTKEFQRLMKKLDKHTHAFDTKEELQRRLVAAWQREHSWDVDEDEAVVTFSTADYSSDAKGVQKEKEAAIARGVSLVTAELTRWTLSQVSSPLELKMKGSGSDVERDQSSAVATDEQTATGQEGRRWSTTAIGSEAAPEEENGDGESEEGTGKQTSAGGSVVVENAADVSEEAVRLALDGKLLFYQAASLGIVPLLRSKRAVTARQLAKQTHEAALELIGRLQLSRGEAAAVEAVARLCGVTAEHEDHCLDRLRERADAEVRLAEWVASDPTLYGEITYRDAHLKSGHNVTAYAGSFQLGIGDGGTREQAVKRAAHSGFVEVVMAHAQLQKKAAAKPQ